VARDDELITAGREHLWHWRIEDALATPEKGSRLCPKAAAAHYLRGEALFVERRINEAPRCHSRRSAAVSSAMSAYATMR